MTENPTYKSLSRQGFESLFHDHFDHLCRFAAGYLNDMDSSKEIVQNVFINLWKNRKTIRSDKTVKAYLFTSVKNRCLNYIRDNKKYRSYFLDVEVEMEIPDNEPDHYEQEDLKNKIQLALDMLPEKCRQVFELKRFEDLKYSEIAEKLDISIKTVEVHMSKALKILREELKDIYLILLLGIYLF